MNIIPIVALAAFATAIIEERWAPLQKFFEWVADLIDPPKF